MSGELDLKLFEGWVYSTKELEVVLSADSYLDLIAFDYNQSVAKYELFNLLSKLVGLGKYETYKLQLLLNKARERTLELPGILEAFYDLYCRGYGFLRRLGLGFGLPMTYLQEPYYGKHWTELSQRELQDLVNSLNLRLYYEIDRVRQWLNNGQIVLTGEKDQIGHYDYLDLRNEDDKNDEVD